MTEAVPASKLDVFISYKREERDVAEALASYLTTQGYDVWWDAALLAGEDFAKIVHAELVEARAVVVLWSKQARGSHWVRAEAALALANGTLINAVIDGMAFEGIPPEFSSIQAVRLGEDAAKFYAEIAGAIARKGTAPSQTGRTVAEATTRLEAKVKDAEFFGVIANSTHVGDFEDYLERFGASAQFASMAKRRIVALGVEEKRRRSMIRQLKFVATGVVGTITALVGLEQLTDIKFSVMLGLNKLFVQDSMKSEAVAAAPDASPAAAVTPATDASLTFAVPVSPSTELAYNRVVRLIETSRESGLSDVTTGEVNWVSGAEGALVRYAGDITFAWGGTARVSFQSSLIPDVFSPEIVLTYVDSFGNGPLANLTGVTGLLADGERVALVRPVINIDKPSAMLASAGRSDGSFDRLVSATTLTLELAFGDDYGTLEIGKPPGATSLRAALFPLNFTPSTSLSDMLNAGPSAIDQLFKTPDPSTPSAPAN